MAAIAFLFGNSNTFAKTEEGKCFRSIHCDTNGIPGYYQWNDIEKCCNHEPGSDCREEEFPCPPDEADVKAVQGGWIINCHLETMDYEVHIDGSWQTVHTSGNNYAFRENEIITFSDCEEFPFINGLEIKLHGITTDNNGYFSVFVPSGRYE